MHRLSVRVLRRVVTRRHWFRCAMTALALSYAAEYVVRNEPYWEPDVDYLHWSTDVPAITVCRVVDDTRDTLWSRPQPRSNGKSSMEHSLVDNTLSVNILKQTNEFKKKDSSFVCKSVFKNCSWNEKYFNCCRHFQPHRFVIEKPCFSINSLQTVNKRKKLITSHFSKKGELKMEFNEKVEISLHSPVDLRFGELQKQYISVDVNEAVELLYTTRQIIEHISLVTLDATKRGCLLQDEKKLFHHSIYSESACLLECALRVPHIYAKNSTLCDCPPPCSGIEINTVWYGTQRSSDNITSCILTMLEPATVRLIMKAKKDYVNLIVIVACLLQLFTGINLMDIPKYILNKSKH